MRISLLKDKKIDSILLPEKVFGNFWITDKDINGLDKNLIAIEAKDNKWILVSNNEAYYTENNVMVPQVELVPRKFYNICKDNGKGWITIYCENIQDSFEYLDITDYIGNGIDIGSTNSFINYQLLKKQEIVLKKEKNSVYAYIMNPNEHFYINNIRCTNKVQLKTGDMLFIYGLKVFLILSNSKCYLALNNPNQNVTAKTMTQKTLPFSSNINFEEPKEEQEMNLYKEDDYFHKMPRFHSEIIPIEMKIDAPPSKQEEESNPFLLTVGPMLTMSMTSMVTGYTAVNNVLSGKTDWASATPSLVICGAMFGSVLVWPMISKAYQKKEQKRKEKERQKKYKQYIDSKREIIQKGITEQSTILKNNYPTTKECEQIILNKYMTLWQRRIEDKDFLELNLGIGNYPMKINIHYPEDHFSMAEDNLKDMVSKLGNEPKILNGVPVPYSLMENYISAYIGNHNIVSEFIKRLIIQITAFHSYDDVKIITLTSKENEYQWNFLKTMPHSFSDDKSIRFFATNNEEYKEICYYLDRIISKRLELVKDAKRDSFDQMYLIITDNFKRVRNYDVITKILESKSNYGFMLMIADDKITNLPDQCKSFIELGNNNQGEIHNSIINNNQKFELDLKSPIAFDECSLRLANVPIEINTNEEGKLPGKVGFLEMYDVGKVEQLNSLARWKNNNPILHLESPVGIGKNGEIISIDLHEKFHGPHGLIAGMTGSGKSEFIITYILSMAVNYHPYEVQFILIDYKGGGLAGAFENKTTGVKLPHLVGTITNLDANEINRSLASIESELKRRQGLFNEAREKSGESTVDIYKYQKMYREGIVSEPISHLFIISDEFAELKTQQPEFMAQLISTARIGRSLGVHLILATQKPSGVVDPQIWSNTRFRICMKVQDKGDSNEVIKCPDAAFLKQTGRFYFQVGYNEVFTLGQAAWAGGKYIEHEKVIKNIDSSIEVINNIGYTIKTQETREKQEVVETKGEELNNIVSYLANLASRERITCRPLWLEKISPEIRVEYLASKYHYEKEPFRINPIIGEYDIPNEQKQCLLTLPLSEEGNALIYGAGGSGKENFITTLIYASMLYHTPEELNYYILDFGSESLKMFSDCPIVGDVLTLSDEDKIANLYKMITKTIEDRKKLFAEYNGDYFNYCQNSGSILPSIVVIINNYESYQENCSKFDDMLNVLSRECEKYGIYFVITLATPNGIRFKLKQNFSLVYALQQNNDDDYITILGNVHKKYPAKIFGRGIMKKEDIYEFQTALVTERENITKFIKEKCQAQKEKISAKAKSIPMLPETVEYKDIAKDFGKGKNMIIGIEKESLNISKFNFIKNYITPITSLELNTGTKLVNALINQYLASGQSNLMVINAYADDYIIDPKYSSYYNYVTTNLDETFIKLNDGITAQAEQYKANKYDKKVLKGIKPTTCFIIGINAFKNKLSEENKPKFQEIFTNAKPLETVQFILVDSIDQLKKIELETWYKNCINNDTGIWVGNGINDQFTLKVSQKIEEMKQEVPDSFCFVVNRGKPVYVKYVENLELQIKQ